MRHGGAGLAIPTFPFTPAGGLLPEAWNFGIAVHFAHRAWAVVLTVILLVFVGKVWSRPETRSAWGWLAAFVSVALCAQIYLGALTVWTVKNPHAARCICCWALFCLAQPML